MRAASPKLWTLPIPCRPSFRPSWGSPASKCSASSTSKRIGSTCSGGTSSSMPVPIEQLVVPLAVVNVVYQAEQDPDYQLTRQDLLKWEGEHGSLPEGCCVAL